MSGLSELPLEQRLRLLLAGEHFSFFVLCCRRTIYFAIFCLCGPFFCTWTSMFIVEHLTAVHIVLQYRKHSTAQRNQPAQSRKASTLRSECDNADRVGGSQQNVVKHLYSTLSSQNERSNRNLPGLERYTTTHSAAGVVREVFVVSFDLSKIQHCSFSPSFLPGNT